MHALSVVHERDHGGRARVISYAAQDRSRFAAQLRAIGAQR